MSEHDSNAEEEEDAPAHTLNALLRNAHQAGISNVGDLRMLFQIDPENGSTPTELREGLGISSGTVCMVTNRLRAMLLTTQTGSTRGSRHFLTEKGHAMRAWIEDGTPLPN